MGPDRSLKKVMPYRVKTRKRKHRKKTETEENLKERKSGGVCWKKASDLERVCEGSSGTNMPLSG